MSTGAAVWPGGEAGPFALDDDRGRLLAGTVTALATCGYGCARPADVAFAAGLPAPSFHRYFPDTEAAALAAYDRALDWLWDQPVPAAPDPRTDWSLQLRGRVESALDLLDPLPDLVRFCALELPRSGAAGFARHQATITVLAALLRGARARYPSAQPLPEFTEQATISGCLYLLATRARPGQSGDLRRLAPDLTYSLLAPYLGVAEACRISVGPSPGQPSPASSNRG